MARKPEKFDQAPPWPLPRTNARLVGHDEAERALLDSFISGKLPHAWLISGPRGIGKATLAHRFARFLLAGEHGGGLFGGAPTSLEVDMRAPAAQRLIAGGHADMRTVEIGYNENTGRKRTEIVIGNVRDLGSFMRLTPAEGGWRVAVIDAADEMNRAATNAVLKLLEEPPPRSVLLLVAHAPGGLLPTVRSRCRRLMLKALPEDTVVELLGQYMPALPADESIALARLSDGSIGRALEFADAGGLKLYGDLFGLLDGLPRLDAAALHAFAERVGRRGDDGERDFRTVAFLLDWWLKTLVRQGAVGEAPASLLAGEAPLRLRLLQGAGLDRWMQVWEKVAHLFARADAVNLDRKQVVLGSLFAFQSAIR
ncbi:MAG: DNA polymerase III subunit delta' [Alphaproteobacteria bacterium]|nr:DNA polymerase III subunit delta' [Alphaproteobacteria bacterium]MCW5739973.1 DNA polymerase III subunit delta' [Alphaproteobacteria bacterium]